MSQIKPLKWSKQGPNNIRVVLDDDSKGSVWALGVGGFYEITKNAILWLSQDPLCWKQFKTVAEAKAAAQADHEQLVRTFLVPECTVSTTGEAQDDE